MSGWSPAALATLRTQRPGLDVVDIWLWPDQAAPFRLAVGDHLTLLQYQAMQHNPVLLAAMEAVLPEEPDADAPAPEGLAPEPASPARRMWDNLDLLGRAFDNLAAVAFVEPRYVPVAQLPADGTRPADGLCLRDFQWADQLRLLDLLQGDLSALATFRTRPAAAAPAASGGEGVRDAAERPPAAAGAGAPAAAVRRGGAVSRRAGGDPLAAGGADAPAAEPAA